MARNTISNPRGREAEGPFGDNEGGGCVVEVLLIRRPLEGDLLFRLPLLILCYFPSRFSSVLGSLR